MDIKLLARFRCGASSRGTEVWRTDGGLCRMCRKELELPSHQMECLASQGLPRREWQEAFDESGRELEFLKGLESYMKEL